MTSMFSLWPKGNIWKIWQLCDHIRVVWKVKTCKGMSECWHGAWHLPTIFMVFKNIRVKKNPALLLGKGISLKLSLFLCHRNLFFSWISLQRNTNTGIVRELCCIWSYIQTVSCKIFTRCFGLILRQNLWKTATSLWILHFHVLSVQH